MQSPSSQSPRSGPAGQNRVVKNSNKQSSETKGGQYKAIEGAFTLPTLWDFADEVPPTCPSAEVAHKFACEHVLAHFDATLRA